jgi:hypothetical protein
MLRPQNTFKTAAGSRKPALWQHSIDRPDTATYLQTLGVFGIMLLTMILVGLLLYAASEYPKAYPKVKEATK